MEKYLFKPRHPTGSVDFLKKLYTSQQETGVKQAEVRLNVAVVGAGLAGLATGLALARSGHNATIYEAADSLGEVGAGIQVAPNSSRHLRRWGVEKYLEGLSVEPDELNTRRWENGKVIGRLAFKPQMHRTYGAPYLQIHRADFHTALKQAALEHGARIRVSCMVVDYDFDSPSLTLQSGEVIKPDFIVAADGVKSIARERFLSSEGPAEAETGYAAYRGTIEAIRLREIPELKWLVEGKSQNVWIGHHRHIITYTLRAGKLFNFVLLHPDTSDPSTWEKEDHSQKMMEQYQGWDPVVTKLISLIENPTKWPITARKPMKKWASDSGRFIIIGDAAHAMVPWMAQGAAMALEDAAALEELLKLLPSKNELPKAMEIYESIRIPRTQRMQEASFLNGYLLHLPDGPEQRARDEASRREVEGLPYTTSSQQWSDPSTQRWAYGYDACEEIRYAWHLAHSSQQPRFKSLL